MNIYNSRSVETGIIDFSEETGADLIAIPTHGRTGLAHLINGSLAEHLAKQDPKPVLSVKIQQILEPRVKEINAILSYENWGQE